MQRIWYWLKSVVLFLLGIVLVVWGFQTNASNNEKKKTVKRQSPMLKQTAERDSVSNSAPAMKAVGDSSKKAPQAVARKKRRTDTAGSSVKSVKPEANRHVEPKVEQKETVIEPEEKAEEASGTK